MRGTVVCLDLEVIDDDDVWKSEEERQNVEDLEEISKDSLEMFLARSLDIEEQ